MTEALFTSKSINFCIAAIAFCSGTLIKMDSLGTVAKREGVLTIFKIIWSVIIGVLLIKLFGQEGIFGIPTIVLVIALCSANPAIFLSLVTDFGRPENKIGFNFVAIFGIPLLTLLVYSFGMSGQSTFSFIPLISTLIPLIVGLVLENMDPGVGKLLGPGIGLLLPILGWQIGQTMNIVASLQSGIFGLLLVVFFYLINSPIFLVDKYVLKQDGVVGMAFNAMLGVSASFPALLAQSYPEVEPYVAKASAQILTGVIATAFITSFLVAKVFKSHYGVSKMSEVTE